MNKFIKIIFFIILVNSQLFFTLAVSEEKIKIGLLVPITGNNKNVGQSIIIQNQLVLGLEAIEGTDQLLQRCFSYKRKGDKGILLKFSKKNQSNLIDIPLIGLETIYNLKKYNYEGVYLQKNKCLIIDKNEIIDYANKNNLFVSSVDLD